MTKMITNYSVKTTIFRALSTLMALMAIGSFLFLISESSTAFKEEVFYKLITCLVLFVSVVLCSLFATLSDVYKKRIETALERQKKAGAYKVKMESLEKELEEDRASRVKRIIIDIPLDD